MKFITLILMVWQQFQVMQIAAENSLADGRNYGQNFPCNFNLYNQHQEFKFIS